MAIRALVCGFGSGATQGGLGVGGGIIMISALSRFGGMTQTQAVGTSLPTQFLSNVVSGLTFASSGMVDPAIAVCLGSASVVGARVGVNLGRGLSETQFRGAFGAVLLLLSPIVAWGSTLQQGEGAPNTDKKIEDTAIAPLDGTPASSWSQVLAAWRPSEIRRQLEAHPYTSARCVCVGVLVGMLSGALGIGATPVMITYLTLATDLEYHACVGTALCAISPCNLMGSLSHAQLGSVLYTRLPPLALGAVVGGVCGSNVSLHLPATQLQQAFAAFCAVWGGSMVRTSGLLRMAKQVVK